jgi:hypothetical protein
MWPYLLLTRAWPAADRAESFDRWQYSKHIPELIQAPGITGAAYYRSMDGVPPAFTVPGLRMAVYAAQSTQGLFQWMESPELAGALADGIQWFGAFHRLDGQDFTGNVYRRHSSTVNRGQVGELHGIMVDRWEIDAPAQAVTAALKERYLPALASLEGVESVTSFERSAEQPPIAFYRSVGRFMVWTGFARAEDLEAAAGSGALAECRAGLAGTLDTASYSTHEAYRLVFHRNRESAPGSDGEIPGD